MKASLLYTDKEKRPTRVALDHYPTPSWVCEEALKLCWDCAYRVLDAGAGAGAWGEAARQRWPQAWIAGVEIREILPPPPAYNVWAEIDFLAYSPPEKFDVIMGNPPYSDAEDFVRKAMSLLQPAGDLVMLFRLPFLASVKRRDGLFKEFKPRRVAICSKRPSFNGKGTNSEDFCLIHWEPHWYGETRLCWIPEE